MKNSLLFFLLLFSTSAFAQTIIYNNGPLITSVGTGAGGADESVLQSTSLGMGSLGVNGDCNSGWTLEDEFTVPVGEVWYIDSISLYGYQAASSTTAKFKQKKVRIVSEQGFTRISTVVNQNGLNTEWTGAYRVDETTTGSASNPIREQKMDWGRAYSSGTHRIAYCLTGLDSLPEVMVPPVTEVGNASTGNMIQIDSNSVENTFLDSGNNQPQGLPFRFFGSLFSISKVDSNGDKIPDIADPCSCTDYQNIKDGVSNTSFHDFIRITSAPGEIWELSAYNSGGLYFFNGALMPIGTLIPEVFPGVYYLDVWHLDNVGFDADFDRIGGGFPVTLNESNACSNSDCVNVPTLSTWGLICMCLFLMSFGSIVLIKKSELSFAGHATAFSIKSTFKNPPMDWEIMRKMVLFTMVLSLFMGLITIVVYGSIAWVDILGFMLAGPLFAYLGHLMCIQIKE